MRHYKQVMVAVTRVLLTVAVVHNFLTVGRGDGRISSGNRYSPEWSIHQSARTGTRPRFEEAVRKVTRLLYADSPQTSFWLTARLPKIYIYDTLEPAWSDLTNISVGTERKFGVAGMGENYTGCSWFPHICDKKQQGVPLSPKAAKYVKYKNDFMVDVAFLNWFERYPYRTWNVSRADLFLVPYPHRSHCFSRFDFSRNRGATPPQEIREQVHEKLTYLSMYPERHLYLHGGGWGEGVLLTQSIDMSNKMTLSLGPGVPCRNRFDRPCGHFTQPNVDVRTAYQPPAVQDRRTEEWWVYRSRVLAVGARMGATPAMKMRWAMSMNVSRFIPEVIGDLPTQVTLTRNRGQVMSAQFANMSIEELYESSHFCLILPGDEQWQKRFFDVMLNGCIPLVPYFFPSLEKEYPTFFQWSGRDSIRLIYPWHKGTFFGDEGAGIDFMDLVLSYNGTCQTCVAATVEWALQNMTEIYRLRRNIMKFVQLFTFGLDDNMYHYSDGFTATLVSLRHYVHSLDGELPGNVTNQTFGASPRRGE